MIVHCGRGFATWLSYGNMQKIVYSSYFLPGFDSETEQHRFDMDYFLDSPIKCVIYFIKFRLYITNRI
jgi:hypothetical protein